MDDPLLKFVLLVPLRYNDGREVPGDVILNLKEKLFSLADGFTDKGTVRGAYRMADGKKQIDQSAEYWIWLKEEYVAELRQVVAELGAKLGQESMYLERTVGTLDFVPPQPRGGGPS